MRYIATILLISLLLSCATADALQLRVKDVASIADGGAHKLLGYGLVVGLQGTGDGKKALFTVQSLANMLEQFGISIEASQLDVDNVAAVMVTGDLPSGAAAGARMDVTVSSLGDAASLQGGTLLLTPLRGADGQIYAIAQGPVSVGGYQAGGRGASVTRNHTAVGRMPNGASVVLPAPASAALSAGRLSLQLHQPDFTTAGRLADSINSGLGHICAHAVNSAMIQVAIPPDMPNLTTLIRHIEALPVQPDMPARVVLNERTGTVVIGSDVRILPVAIAHGALTVQIMRRYSVSQPPPLVYHDAATSITTPVLAVPDDTLVATTTDRAASDHDSDFWWTADRADDDANSYEAASGTINSSADIGVISPPTDDTMILSDDNAEVVMTTASWVEIMDEASPAVVSGGASHGLHRLPSHAPHVSGGGHTVVVPEDSVRVDEQETQLMTIGGEATLSDLVEALNVLGVSPRDLIAIIQALKQAGALQAELIIQ